MMVHVDSKPLALPVSSLVVGTAQGDVSHYGRRLFAYVNYRDRAVAPTGNRSHR